MAKKRSPQAIKLDKDELAALKQRIANKQITEQDLKFFGQLIEFNLWLQSALGKAKLSIRRLRGMFGFKTEKRTDKPIKDASSEDEQALCNEATSEKAPPETTGSSETNETLECVEGERQAKPSKPPVWDKAANHGRYGFEDYAGCKTVTILHETLSKGAVCPACEAAGERGLLYEPNEGFASYIVLEGHGVITGTRYQVQKLRCGFCSCYYQAALPEALTERGIVKAGKYYDVSCATTLAFQRYIFGMPFKRIETAQSMQKIPIPDATQWDKVSKAYQSIEPVYHALRKVAAEGDPSFDDTPNRILLSAPLRNGRKGIYTTALRSRFEGQDIFLFETSHRHAGENIGQIFQSRLSQEPICSMSDASANNKPKGVDEVLLSRWIVCFCLVHGRRRFYELIKQFDKESEFVLEVIGCVYHHERHCQKEKLNPEARLAYHQSHSSPLMEALWAWLNNKRLHEEVEPNSPLGDAIAYLLKYWKQLTQFLRYPGALLDNNLCERAIKVVIRHRRNSLFFRSFFGAKVGDGLMSLMYTAMQSGIDVFLYLNRLQTETVAVASNPEAWLPWRYEASYQHLRG